MERKMFTLLVAEDEEASRMLYCEELLEEGYRVLTAANGLQVLGILEDQKIDLLMTDIKMPDMHALEMIPLVRQEHPLLPILVASAFKGMENDFALRECLINGFFPKPVNMEALKRTIRQILEGKLAKAG